MSQLGFRLSLGHGCMSAICIYIHTKFNIFFIYSSCNLQRMSLWLPYSVFTTLFCLDYSHLKYKWNRLKPVLTRLLLTYCGLSRYLDTDQCGVCKDLIIWSVSSVVFVLFFFFLASACCWSQNTALWMNKLFDSIFIISGRDEMPLM